MNDLVFVMYNLKLKERQLRRDSKISYDPDDVPSDDEWITEKENPALPQDKHWLRNLDRIAQRTANLTLEDDDAEAEVETMVRDIDESCIPSFSQVTLFHLFWLLCFVPTFC